MHLSDIREQLTKNGYLPNNEIVMAAYGTLHGVPLLVESVLARFLQLIQAVNDRLQFPVELFVHHLTDGLQQLLVYHLYHPLS